jgi:hypothetical protein
MNPLLSQFLGALLRHVLNFAGGWLVARGILQPDQVDDMIAGAVVFVLAVVWSWVEKYRAQLMENTRAAMPAGTTRREAQDLIASGTKASASTSADVPPLLKETRYEI